MNIKSTVLAISLGLVPCAVFAEGSDKHSYDDHQTYNKQEDRSEHAASFEAYDQNNDGLIEEDEVMSVNDDGDTNFAATEFENLDEDNDSEVTRDEWNEYFSQN